MADLSARSARRTDLGGAFTVESDVSFDHHHIGTVVADDFDNADSADNAFDASEWFSPELTAQWRKGATYRDWLQHEGSYSAAGFDRRHDRITRLGNWLMASGTLFFLVLILGI